MAGSAEDIKKGSRRLRGDLVGQLAQETPSFTEEGYQLLKFHGVYQQDDRDLRSERRKLKQDKAWIMMVRTKIPGGRLTPDQYLAMDRLAAEVANGTLRITSRQDIQFHGILKSNLREAIRRINESGVTTMGACGDVVRNVMATPVPLDTPANREAQRLAQEMSDAFLFKRAAYTEIWLDGQKVPLPEEGEEEPVYGEAYLPRKFKIGVAIPPRNDVDIYTNDLGFVAHAPNGEIEGYTVLVGGGMGMAHGKAETWPALARPLFYVRKEHAIEAAGAVVTTQRDYGNRENRQNARLKYLIDKRGLDWFRNEVASRMKAPFEDAKPLTWDTVEDPLGWHEQGDGQWFCGVRVECGRIKDADGIRMRSGIRAIVERLRKPMRFTPNSNILFCDLEEADRPVLDGLLKEYGIPGPESYTRAGRVGLVCVALPTCGLALAESERVFPQVMEGINRLLREFGLEEEPLLVRMTGCPNGCTRPYNADIAFVGRAPGKYAMYVGGSHTGDRLGGLLHKTVALEAISDHVRPLLQEFVDSRQSDETFSAWWGRTHSNGPAPHASQFHEELAERAVKLAGSGAAGE